MVVEVQQLENRENRVFWCSFGFHQDFCIGTVAFDRPSRVMSLEIIKLPYKKTDHQISNHYPLQAKRNHFVASVSLTAVSVVF